MFNKENGRLKRNTDQANTKKEKYGYKKMYCKKCNKTFNLSKQDIEFGSTVCTFCNSKLTDLVD